MLHLCLCRAWLILSIDSQTMWTTANRWFCTAPRPHSKGRLGHLTTRDIVKQNLKLIPLNNSDLPCSILFHLYMHPLDTQLEQAMALHSSTLAWKVPWTEEPGRLQSMGSLKVVTTEWLHFHFSLSCIGEGNGTPLQYSCLENPRDRGA